jgi:hypothetical protein
VARASASGLRRPLAQAVAGQFDAVGVVNDAVEDGVGEGRDADQLVPAGDRNLAGDDERAFVVAVFDDFQEIAGLVGAERLRSPIIQDEQFYAGERSQQPGVARIAMRDGEVREETGNAGVENGQVFPASFVAERAGEPTLAETGCPRDDEITARRSSRRRRA